MTPQEQDTPKKRIKILRDGIDALPDDYKGFDMDNFVNGTSDNACKYYHSGMVPSNGKFECGTTLCASGHAILFGIKPLPEHFDEEGDLDWGLFSIWLCGDSGYDDVWTFLFSYFWPSDPKQFVARADLFLNDNIPDKWDFKDKF